MSTQGVRIENWVVFTHFGNAKQHLRGHVYGHPAYLDGQLMTTSAVIELDDNAAVTTSGTVYRLGRRWQAPIGGDVRSPAA